MTNMEVMEFTDKVVRDFAFEDLRKNGNELERQVVRFSGCEKTGETEKGRSIYQTTWSLAYPRS